MSVLTPRKKNFELVRVNQCKLNHHLYKKGSEWWIRFTVRNIDGSKRHIRLRLHTKIVVEARRRREDLFYNQHRFSIRIEAANNLG